MSTEVGRSCRLFLSGQARLAVRQPSINDTTNIALWGSNFEFLLSELFPGLRGKDFIQAQSLDYQRSDTILKASTREISFCFDSIDQVK
jgi:hypothetical protein